MEERTEKGHSYDLERESSGGAHWMPGCRAGTLFRSSKESPMQLARQRKRISDINPAESMSSALRFGNFSNFLSS